MIVITGLGRTGTSFLAKWCKESGVDPGGVWNNNVDAGMEDSRVVTINEKIIWDNQPKVDNYKKSILLINKPVIKDPRFSVGGKVLSIWWKIRQDLKFIVLHRKPENVVKSRLRHSKGFIEKYRGTDVTIYKTHFADFVTTLLKFDIPYKMFYFPTFLNRFESLYNAFKDFGLTFDYAKSKNTWFDLVDITKVHV